MMNDADFESKFIELTSRYSRETSHLSSIMQMHRNENYKEMLKMGHENPSLALSLALMEIPRHKNLWGHFVFKMFDLLNIVVPPKPESVRPGYVEECHNWLIEIAKGHGFPKVENPEQVALEMDFGNLLDKLYRKTWCWDFTEEWFTSQKIDFRTKEEILSTEEFQKVISLGPGIRPIAERYIGREDEHRKMWLQMILDRISEADEIENLTSADN